MTSITVAVRRFAGYKYLLCLALIIISQFSFHSWLGFTFLVLRLQSMEDKRGTKRAHLPSKERSLSLDGAKTPAPAPSGSPPPLTLSHPVLRPNQMLIVCVPMNQAYTYTVEKIDTD
jgi:hypothetical protein